MNLPSLIRTVSKHLETINELPKPKPTYWYPNDFKSEYHEAVLAADEAATICENLVTKGWSHTGKSAKSLLDAARLIRHNAWSKYNKEYGTGS